MRLALLLATFWLNGAAPEEMRFKKTEKISHLCDLQIMTGKNIHCICVPDKYGISKAECVIIGTNADTNLMWTLAESSQPFIPVLNIIANNLSMNVPSDVLSQMFHLKNMSISLASIGHLERFVFGNSTSIEYLKLYNNHISFLDLFSLSYLPRLRCIDLHMNQIQEIKRYVFHNMANMRTLLLNDNHIRNIEDKAFVELANLRYLDLSKNYICNINNTTLYGLAKLEVIDLSYNRIVCLTSLVFTELWDLKELYLNDNLIEFISNRTFGGLQFMYSLSLRNNRILELPAGFLSDNFNVLNLDISNNRLETVSLKSIEQLYDNLWNGTIDLRGLVASDTMPSTLSAMISHAEYKAGFIDCVAAAFATVAVSLAAGKIITNL